MNLQSYCSVFWSLVNIRAVDKVGALFSESIDGISCANAIFIVLFFGATQFEKNRLLNFKHSGRSGRDFWMWNRKASNSIIKLRLKISFHLRTMFLLILIAITSVFDLQFRSIIYLIGKYLFDDLRETESLKLKTASFRSLRFPIIILFLRTECVENGQVKRLHLDQQTPLQLNIDIYILSVLFLN